MFKPHAFNCIKFDTPRVDTPINEKYNTFPYNVMSSQHLNKNSPWNSGSEASSIYIVLYALDVVQAD